MKTGRRGARIRGINYMRFYFRKKVIFRKCPVCVRALREENNSGLCSICNNREKNKNMWYQFSK